MKDVDQLTDEELLAEADDVDSMSDDELLAAASEDDDGSIGPLTTGMMAHVDQLTAGHGPQVYAGIDKLLSPSTDYASRRDAYRQTIDEGKAKNPISGWTGTATGVGTQIAATMGIPMAKIASPVARAATQAAANLGLLAAQNPGDVEGEITPLQLPERLNQINPLENPISTTLAAGLPFAGPIAAKVMGTSADELAAKAFSPTAKEAADGLKKKGMPSKSTQKLGSFARESGIAKPMSDAQKLYDRASNKVQEVGGKIGTFVEENSPKISEWIKRNPDAARKAAADSFDFNNSKVRMLLRLDDEIGDNREAMEKAVDYLTKELDHYQSRYQLDGSPLDFAKLQDLRSKIQGTINYNRKAGAVDPFKESVSKVLVEEIDRAMDSGLDLIESVAKGTKGDMAKLRREYAMAKTLEERSLRQAGRDGAEKAEVGVPGVTKSFKAGPKTYTTAANAAAGTSPAVSMSPTLMNLGFQPSPRTLPPSPLMPAEELSPSSPSLMQAGQTPPAESNAQKARRMNQMNQGM